MISPYPRRIPHLGHILAHLDRSLGIGERSGKTQDTSTGWFSRREISVPGTRLELVQLIQPGDFKSSAFPSTNSNAYPVRIRKYGGDLDFALLQQRPRILRDKGILMDLLYSAVTSQAL